MIRDTFVKYSAYIIAYLSISGYFLAYKYKYGYYSYFNIPSVYVNNIDLIDIINMISAIIAFLGLGIYMILTHRPREKEKHETWFSRINQTALPVVILLMVASYFDIGIIRTLSLIIILLIYFYNLILPLLVQRNVKGYNNKIAAFFRNINNMSFMEVLEHKIKYQAFTLIIVILVLTYSFGGVIYLLGYQNAKDEKLFDVTEVDKIKHIVFNVNDDKVIATAINNNVLSKEYSLHSKSDVFIRKEKLEKLEVE